MTVLCEVKMCPYYDKKSGLCQSEAVMINSKGVCNHLTYRGWDAPLGDEFLRKPNVLTIVRAEEVNKAGEADNTTTEVTEATEATEVTETTEAVKAKEVKQNTKFKSKKKRKNS